MPPRFDGFMRWPAQSLQPRRPAAAGAETRARALAELQRCSGGIPAGRSAAPAAVILVRSVGARVWRAPNHRDTKRRRTPVLCERARNVPPLLARSTRDDSPSAAKPCARLVEVSGGVLRGVNAPPWQGAPASERDSSFRPSPLGAQCLLANTSRAATASATRASTAASIRTASRVVR
eukprot:363172-Chlamydomonas_euryale.AAC.2